MSTFTEHISSKRALAPLSERQVYVMNENGWGNDIGWFTVEKLRVMGFKSRKPEPGDLLRVTMESGRTGIYEFSKMDYCYDPSDMFFGSVRFLCYADENVDAVIDKRRAMKAQQDNDRSVRGRIQQGADTLRAALVRPTL